jgi:hypothetical protein
MPQSRVITQLGEVTNTCFVVMPFASMFEREYMRVIRPAVEAAGLECVRGDEIYSEQSIVQDIWKSVRHARVIVAELSGRNPNVMYEVGLAHALGKPIVLLTRNQEDVPFDLKSLRYIYYDTENPDWGADLRGNLTTALEKVLESASIAAHLADIKVETHLPAAPEHALVRPTADQLLISLAGIWRTSWISFKLEREHVATLIIPEGHGAEFTASLTVAYVRDGEQTVVEETLKGYLSDRKLSLTAVNYTYVQRGRSVGYNLDKFDLVAPTDYLLEGKITLKYGEREVRFTRSVIPR